MTFNPDCSGLVAVGSYSGLVGLYTEGDRGVVSVLEGHRGGVTQVRAFC
jgi:hypothetical protein